MRWLREAAARCPIVAHTRKASSQESIVVGFFLLCALAGLSQGVGRECVDVGCGMWEDGGIEVL